MGVLPCIFCKETGKQNIKQLSEERLSLVKSTSQRRQDNACISTYTSKTHIYQHPKKRRQDGKKEVPDSRKSRRSTKTAFDFRTFCFLVNTVKRSIESIQIAFNNITTSTTMTVKFKKVA